MDCPKCGYKGKFVEAKWQGATHVIGTRNLGDKTIRRKRECYECKHTFETYEEYVPQAPLNTYA